MSTDEQLMLLYQQGESRAFEELYSRHSGRVYAHLKYKLHQPGEAEDLLQQVFMKLHQYRMNYDTTLPFMPWLFSMMRNLLIDHYRKQRPVPVEQERLASLVDRREQESASPAPAIDWEQVLSLLPEDQQKLIAQRFEEGLSYEDIARLSGINESSARKRVSRTVQGLRKRLLG